MLSYPDTGAEAEADELARLQRFVRELGEATHTAATPLFVAADRISAWGWLPCRAAPPDVVARVREFVLKLADSPSVGIGSPAAGVEGFRWSHHQALGAHAVAVARGQHERTVTAATDPGLSVARCWVLTSAGSGLG